LDVVVFGATGFVGRLVAGYLAEHAPAGTRIGLAGRSPERLDHVREDLGPAAASWPLLVADTRDASSLDAMATATSVVATTVGPYARYGMPVVEACARAGTDYADLTGEVLFVRDCLDRYGELSVASGARIVHSCGFDSIPSDLGVLLLAEQARFDGEGQLEDTRLVVTSMKGSFSGGTIDSMRASAQAVAADRSLLRVLADPYALSPDRPAEPDMGAQRDFAGIRRDRELGVWVGPFVMAPYNTRVVRLSNALQKWAYGPRFRYREWMSYGSGVTAPVSAAALSAGTAGALVGMGFRPTRAILDRFLPAPGEGPDEQSRRRGHFRIEIRTRTSTGARYRCVVAAQGDPGYQATSVMLGESALCLALDHDRLPDRVGVLTPATALGDVLVDRLRAAGFTFTVERARPAGGAAP
jgi:short subunit dehydrogenase-like uncharacterized protein